MDTEPLSYCIRTAKEIIKEALLDSNEPQLKEILSDLENIKKKIERIGDASGGSRNTDN